jgi:hypothetical protein
VLHSAESIFLLDNPQLSILLYCHGVSKSVFWYTVPLMTKAETLVFRLRAVQKNSVLCNTAWIFSNIFYTTPRYAAQNGADSVLCYIAQSHLYLRLSLSRIRNHMQKWFYPLISDPRGIDWWKNRGSKWLRSHVQSFFEQTSWGFIWLHFRFPQSHRLDEETDFDGLRCEYTNTNPYPKKTERLKSRETVFLKKVVFCLLDAYSYSVKNLDVPLSVRHDINVFQNFPRLFLTVNLYIFPHTKSFSTILHFHWQGIKANCLGLRLLFTGRVFIGLAPWQLTSMGLITSRISQTQLKLQLYF